MGSRKYETHGPLAAGPRRVSRQPRPVDSLGSTRPSPGNYCAFQAHQGSICQAASDSYASVELAIAGLHRLSQGFARSLPTLKGGFPLAGGATHRGREFHIRKQYHKVLRERFALVDSASMTICCLRYRSDAFLDCSDERANSAAFSKFSRTPIPVPLVNSMPRRSSSATIF